MNEMSRAPSIAAALAAAFLLVAVSTGALDAFAAPDPGDTAGPSVRPRPLVVGEDAPPLAAQRVAGPDPVTLDGLAGRVVILDFWATWCGPCRAVMPLLDAMYQARGSEGLSIVGVSPESDQDIRAHLAQHPVHYTVARDVGGTVRAYGVRGIPMLVVLDRAGKVREVMMGVDGPSFRRLDTLVTQLLAEPAP